MGRKESPEVGCGLTLTEVQHCLGRWLTKPMPKVSAVSSTNTIPATDKKVSAASARSLPDLQTFTSVLCASGGADGWSSGYPHLWVHV